MKKVYYAHFMGIYNTPQEKRDIATLEALGFEVVNPNTPEIQKECQEKLSVVQSSKEYQQVFDSIFNPLIDQCEVFAFKPLPDCRIPGGIWKEIQRAQKEDKIIIELPTGLFARAMGREDTREYLYDIGQR